MGSTTLTIGKAVDGHLKGVTPSYVDNSDIIVINQRCIHDNLIDYSLARYQDPGVGFSSKKIVRVGDILINSTGQGTAGRVAFVKELPSNKTVITDSHVLIIRIEDYITAGVIEFNLSYIEQKLQTYIDGSTGQGEFDKVRLFNTSIQIPEDSSARLRAFNILDMLEKKIALNTEVNERLEELTRDIYNYWFVQHDYPNDSNSPYRSSGGPMKKDDYGHDMPSAWDMLPVGDIVKLQPGVSYTSSEIADNIGIPMINLGSIDKNREYRDDKIKFFSGKVGDNKLVSPGEMLLACTDLTSEGLIIGCPIFVPNHYDRFTFSMDLSKINIIDGQVLAVYLYMTLRTDWYHKYINRFASGTNVRHLDTSGVTRYRIQIPPIELQRKFENIVQPIFDRINDALVENQELLNLRNSLLPLLMSGQIKIGD